ncbi:MAG TPA: T9SS type A sorting domain-containing protein, partial [bacterium]|nr:T9SS type A sorting domain-containing protein [bacterium]
QMEPTDSASVSGAIFVDNLRLVKKSKGEAPPNYAPVVEEINDTTVSKGDYCKVYVNYTDQNENDDHQIIPKADTSAIMFSIKGHTPGSRVYIVPKSDYVGESQVSIIVRDYGVGELADTTTFTLNVTTSAIEQEQLVQKYSLSQNYPNPFNPTTNIDFTVPEAGNVKIIVYDLTGRKVAEPINNFYQPGAYKFTFNAKDLASGVYLYRLITNNKVITRKMMLLK